MNLLLQAACKTPGGQVEPSAKEPAGQKQQTMHALEMLLPQEHHATPATELTYAKQLSLTPVNVQPVTTARTQAGHNNSLLMSPSHARTDCAQSRSIGLDSLMSPEQRLASPASQLGALPFTASKPPALTRQQQQQQQLQQGSDLPAAPGPVGLLELALSTDQIALLQTAADNAQLYLEKESSPEDEDAVAGIPFANVTTHCCGAELGCDSMLCLASGTHVACTLRMHSHGSVLSGYSAVKRFDNMSNGCICPVTNRIGHALKVIIWWRHAACCTRTYFATR